MSYPGQGVAWVGSRLGPWGWLGQPALCVEDLEGQAQVDWTLIGLGQTWTLKHAGAAVPTGVLWACGSHGWPYLSRELDQPLFLRVTLLTVFWLSAAAAARCSALPSLPRDLRRRHPGIDCTVRNPEGVDCRVNGVSQAPSPRCLGN